jgi:hypothetical protein
MKRKSIYFLTFIVFVSFIFDTVYAQIDKEKVGSDQVTPVNGAFYNFSDKNGVNIEVNIWGYIKNPGKYLIPKGSTFIDLVSYAGGPYTESNLEDIRILRLKNDSLKIKENTIININYNDLLWEEKANPINKNNPVLLPGDIVVFPGHPRYFWRDNISLIASISATIVSVATLIILIFRKQN